MQPRTLALVFGVIPLLAGSLACAQPYQTFKPPSSGAEPAKEKEAFPLAFESSSADAGQHLTSELSVSHTFTFVNRSDRVVKPAVSVGCGRTAMLNKRVLQPGESGDVTLIIPILGRDGPCTQTATVYDTENRESSHVVKLSVDVIPVIRIDTNGKTQIPEGESRIIECVLTGLGADFDVTEVKGSSPDWEAVIGTPEPTTIRGRQARRVPVAFHINSDARVGARWQAMTFVTTNSDMPQVSHHFQIEIISPIRILAGSIVLAPSTNSLSGAIQLVARDSLPFAPSMIEVVPDKGPPPSVSWSYEMCEGRLGVKVSTSLETEADVSIKGTIIIHTGGFARPIKIPYRGFRKTAGKAFLLEC